MATNDNALRLSRLSYPRATFRAMLLVALVFLGFGLVAQASASGFSLHGSLGALAGHGPNVAGVWTLLIFTS